MGRQAVMTLPKAPPGAGKTTILEALENCGSSPTRRPHLGIPDPKMSLEVETLGNPELLRRHRDLVFLNEDSFVHLRREVPEWLRSDDPARLEEDAKRIYLQWLPYRESPLGRYTLREVLWKGFGMGDIMMASLAYVFAARNQLGLDLPLVMERPFGMLDCYHGEKLASYISQLPNQVILLMTLGPPEWKSRRRPLERAPLHQVAVSGDLREHALPVQGRLAALSLSKADQVNPDPVSFLRTKGLSQIPAPKFEKTLHLAVAIFRQMTPAARVLD